MTISNTLYKLPKDIPLKNTDLYIDLIVHGQGVFLFNLNECLENMPICMIGLTDNDEKDNGVEENDVSVGRGGKS